MNIEYAKLYERISDVISNDVETFARVQGGYTNAIRGVVRFKDGSTAFAKCATDRQTGNWLRAEIKVYRELSADFMPTVLGWDETDLPLLLLEDLSECAWPPPWNSDRVNAVLQSLEEIHAIEMDVPAYREIFTHRGWHEVAESPESFLSIGIADEDWLTGCLPVLLDARDSVVAEGTTLAHFDVRSDNICFRHERALLIDWNNACKANPDLDTAFWVLSLHHEGGPQPQSILPNAGGLASYVTGYYASRAGRPDPPHTTRIRQLQRDHLRIGLKWMVEALGLPEPKNL